MRAYHHLGGGAGSRASIPDPCHQIRPPSKDYSARWNGILSLRQGGGGTWLLETKRVPGGAHFRQQGPLCRHPRDRAAHTYYIGTQYVFAK